MRIQDFFNLFFVIPLIIFFSCLYICFSDKYSSTIIFGACIVSFVSFFILFIFFNEVYLWNNGFCKKNRNYWILAEHYTVDSTAQTYESFDDNGEKIFLHLEYFNPTNYNHKKATLYNQNPNLIRKIKNF